MLIKGTFDLPPRTSMTGRSVIEGLDDDDGLIGTTRQSYGVIIGVLI